MKSKSLKCGDRNSKVTLGSQGTQLNCIFCLKGWIIDRVQCVVWEKRLISVVVTDIRGDGGK